MTRLWCRIHGQDGHLHIEVCGACGKAKTDGGELTCQATCGGPGYKRWLSADEDQRTWRCVER